MDIQSRYTDHICSFRILYSSPQKQMLDTQHPPEDVLVTTWDSVVPMHSRGSELVSTLFSVAGDSHHAFLSVQKKGIITLAQDVITPYL